MLKLKTFTSMVKKVKVTSKNGTEASGVASGPAGQPGGTKNFPQKI